MKIETLLKLYPFKSKEYGDYNGIQYENYYSSDFVISLWNTGFCMARIFVNDNWQYINKAQVKNLLIEGYVDFQKWN